MSKEDKRLENGVEPNIFFSLKASHLSLIPNHSILDVPKKGKGNIRETGRCNQTPRIDESRTESKEERKGSVDRDGMLKLVNFRGRAFFNVNKVQNT